MKHKDYEIGSGNVFRDLQLKDAGELDIKAGLAILIIKAIAKREWTQTRAAEFLGLDQPKVSAIARGHLEKFSVERLCELLAKLGYDIAIRPRAKRDAKPGRVLLSLER